MPSVLLSAASGAPFPIVSGNYFSGQGIAPFTGIQLILDVNASGAAYISLSGGTTVNSGGFLLSGINKDGLRLGPGGALFIPKGALLSGSVNVFVTCDATGSGQSRLYWQNF